jgi:hypothetical protein
MPNLQGDRTHPFCPIFRSGYQLDTNKYESTLGGYPAVCQPKKMVFAPCRNHIGVGVGIGIEVGFCLGFLPTSQGYSYCRILCKTIE